MTNTGDWEVLTTLNTEEEATLVKGFLESAGIPCLLESLYFTQEPVTLGTLGRVHVRVPRGRRDEAARLLAEQLSSTRDAEPTAGSGPAGDSGE